METLPEELLETLRTLPSPAICNAIETFKVRGRNEGFMDGTIHCQFPDLGPMVGYAATAKIRTAGRGDRLEGEELWRHVASTPAPRIIVVQDLDNPAGVGCFWGEVHANVFKALGCVGAVTNGCIRDLDEVHDLGFHLFGGSIGVSHAYAHIVAVGVEVAVGGLIVKPGDLLHSDQHGVVSIPPDTADQLPDIARRQAAEEREVIALCQSPDFTVEKLVESARRA